MKHGENTTYVQYTLVRGTAPAEVSLKALVNYRDYHAATHAGDWRMQIEPIEAWREGDGVRRRDAIFSEMRGRFVRSAT